MLCSPGYQSLKTIYLKVYKLFTSPEFNMEVYQSNINDEPENGIALLIIDPQNDFHPGGSLAVPTANEDATKIANLIATHGDKISNIFVTLDTHQRFHIAHSMFWKDKNGANPAPFTIIPHSAVKNGEWTATRDEFKEWSLNYTKKLEENGRFQLCIWPDHCLVGTTGHAVHPEIGAALLKWEEKKLSATHYVMKGNNSLTEHYSAIRADVLVESDPNTAVNTKLVESLKRFDRVLICGQALSHCVNFTTRDLAEEWDSSKLNGLVVLTDAASSVPGFEQAGEQFLADMKVKGLTLSTCAQVFEGSSL